MGSAASRPRPRPADQSHPPYQGYTGPQASGPYFLGPHTSTTFNTAYQNNGQYTGGFQGPRGHHGPLVPGQQRPYSGSAPTPNTGADKQLSQTATIRNAVNVQKSSIAAARSSENPDKLAISFTFDASAPCMVTVFIAAKEEVTEGCKIVPFKQPTAAGAQLDKGLGLTYPGPAVSGAVVDLTQHAEEELLGVKETSNGLQYPLIIRLETITEQGLAEGHSLSELVAGGPQKEWVQSQTTFAQLAKDEDGSYRVRPLKQKIWVKGISYELQEIYGIEHATAAAKDREGVATGVVVADQEEERNCVICMVNSRDTTVLPCRHMCMCHDCAQELRKQTSKCPICRNHVESLLHIRMTKQQAPKNPATPLDQSTVSAALDKLGLKSSGKETDKPGQKSSGREVR